MLPVLCFVVGSRVSCYTVTVGSPGQRSTVERCVKLLHKSHCVTFNDVHDSYRFPWHWVSLANTSHKWQSACVQQEAGLVACRCPLALGVFARRSGLSGQAMLSKLLFSSPRVFLELWSAWVWVSFPSIPPKLQASASTLMHLGGSLGHWSQGTGRRRWGSKEKKLVPKIEVVARQDPLLLRNTGLPVLLPNSGPRKEPSSASSRTAHSGWGLSEQPCQAISNRVTGEIK